MSEKPYSADPVFATLKDFQHDTVRYVLRRLYDDPDAVDRFLVADEVGMGKTLVAKGVIAGAIERMQAESHHVERIDVLYICSNADIARQNIGKLDVMGDGSRPMNTRITMLARQAQDLNQRRSDGMKTVNLIAFTPGTSFDKGRATGHAGERALLANMLMPQYETRAQRNAVSRLLSGGVGSWDYHLERNRDYDPSIGDEFLRLLDASPIGVTLDELVEACTGRSELPQWIRSERRELVGGLRHLLARASVSALEPDLIILDEFQRFKHLLSPPADGPEAEIGQLAHELFTWPDAKVLLLSATPYKMFTYAEERALTGDDHYEDFLATAHFLAHPHGDVVTSELRRSLTEFRDQLVSGGDPRSAKTTAEQILRKYMCRTERPTLAEGDMGRDRVGGVASPTAGDLRAFVGMRHLAEVVDGQISVDYWKSAPYFVNFMDGYKIGRKVKESLQNSDLADETADAVAAVPKIDPTSVERRAEIDAGNPRLRSLAAETVGAGMWKLLWLPPSLPYYQSSGAFCNVDPVTTTKRIVFSSWSAAPSSIAALLSHEASIRMMPASTAPPAARLTIEMDGERAAGMTALVLTVPNAPLAMATDPRTFAAIEPARVAPAESVVGWAEARVEPLIGASPAPLPGATPETWYWVAALRWGRSAATPYSPIVDHLLDADGRPPATFLAHLERADLATRGGLTLGAHPDRLAYWTSLAGLAAPGNCAWRALRTVVGDWPQFTEGGLLSAATIVADGFRTLFNRAEVAALVDQLYPDERLRYWQRVLMYCLDGNLQSVLDEYFHHLIDQQNPVDDESLRKLANDVADVVAFGRGRIQAFDPAQPGKPIVFSPRFALRYGDAKGDLRIDEEDGGRLSNVQSAFNSPFWPMVLASTSVGQEGVDFHWWCHSLVHWNQPANVVDLEQREGRVHRYMGHAVRKNVATAHRAEALQQLGADPWSTAFEAAAARRPDELNDLWPHWVYPGDAKVECWVPYLPLSRDIQKEERLRRERVLYRLAFGQPRQSDLLEVISAGGAAVSQTAASGLQINLRPPRH